MRSHARDHRLRKISRYYAALVRRQPLVIIATPGVTNLCYLLIARQGKTRGSIRARWKTRQSGCPPAHTRNRRNTVEGLLAPRSSPHISRHAEGYQSHSASAALRRILARAGSSSSGAGRGHPTRRNQFLIFLEMNYAGCLSRLDRQLLTVLTAGGSRDSDAWRKR